MKHSEIDDQAFVERYVTGKLAAADVARFEEHYLSCPTCIRAVEDAERLQRGLQQVAAEDVVAQQAVAAGAWHALRSRWTWALATAALAIGLLPAAFLWQRTDRLDADLDRARLALADERRPRANTPILALVPTRSGEQPLQQITLLAEPEWIILAVELGDAARPRYAAELVAADDSTIWASDDLEPSYRGTVTMSLHSSLLPAGTYALRLESEGQTLVFPLRVIVS